MVVAVVLWAAMAAVAVVYMAVASVAVVPRVVEAVEVKRVAPAAMAALTVGAREAASEVAMMAVAVMVARLGVEASSRWAERVAEAAVWEMAVERVDGRGPAAMAVVAVETWAAAVVQEEWMVMAAAMEAPREEGRAMVEGLGLLPRRTG